MQLAEIDIATVQDLRKAAIALSAPDCPGVSTTFIQRKLGIGYNRAARLMEALESAAIVSAPNHVGKRQLVDADALQRLATGEPLSLAADASQPPGTTSVRLSAPDGTTIFAGTPQEFMKAAEDMARKDRPPMKPDADFKKHNQDAYRVTADELRQFIERFEQLECEKKDIAETQKELMAEAKGRGYDTRVMRMVVALRKRKPDDVAEQEAVLELYKSALGMT